MDSDQKSLVLIVDDENSNILALTHILSPEYVVFAAKNGQNAIKAAEKHHPDVILLDIIMPQMNGYEVLAELKKSEVTRGIPVVFISGLSSAADEEKGLSLGAVDYISKPFSPAIVKLRVRNQIRMINQLRTIERLSMVDQLTDLPNRRSFDARLSMEWSRAQRELEQISILLIDIDKFKVYNDTYGHQQGDVALQAVARAFGATLHRPGDFAARWGGEEFIVLLPNTDADGAIDVAERIRLYIEAMLIPDVQGEMTKVTVSIGVNSSSDVQNDTIIRFIAGADEALYKGKQTGRNRVMLCE